MSEEMIIERDLVQEEEFKKNDAQIEKELKQVAYFRSMVKKLGAIKKTAEEKFKKDNKVLIENLITHKKDLGKFEIGVKELAKAQWELSRGSKLKKYSGGVGVRVGENIDYTYDELVALEWCMAHKIALSVNTLAFEKLIETKAIPCPEFVKITKTEVVTPTIPSKIILEGEEC